MRRARVGVRELRQNLSKYLRRVRRGETLEVTERGEGVAVLGPIPERLSPLEQLIAEGRATRPIRRLEDLGPPLEIDLPVPLSRILDELREDRL